MAATTPLRPLADGATLLRPDAELVGASAAASAPISATSGATSSTRAPHRHLLIIPGAPTDVVEEDGRAITVTIASPRVPGSPNYRLMLRNRAVRAALAQLSARPDRVPGRL